MSSQDMLVEAKDALKALDPNDIVSFASGIQPDRNEEPGRTLLAVLGLVRVVFIGPVCAPATARFVALQVNLAWSAPRSDIHRCA